MGLVPPKPGIPRKILEVSAHVAAPGAGNDLIPCGSHTLPRIPKIPKLLPGVGASPLDAGMAGNKRDWELLILIQRGLWDLEAPEEELQARQSRIFHLDAADPVFPDPFVDRIPAGAWISIGASLFPLLPRIPVNFICLSSQPHFSLLPGALLKQIFPPGKPQLSRDFTAPVGKLQLIPKGKTIPHFPLLVGEKRQHTDFFFSVFI